MVDLRRPRRGSMAVRPRKRAKTQNVRVYWQKHQNKRVLGIAGYKAGMMHLSYIDNSESPTKGQEIVSAATVIEIPAMLVYGLRFYNTDNSLGDILTADERILKKIGTKKKRDDKTPAIEEIKDVKLLVFSQPDKTTIGKKHIERMEIGLGGKDINEKIEYAKSMLGKELNVNDVFKAGEFVDVISVTKGKGWQGAVKRFVVKTQRPKSTGKVRHVGTLGQWHPAYVLYTVPQAGQTGYHTRTERNKMIMKIGNMEEDINPSAGFPHYGFVRNNYMIVHGSIPGAPKRIVKIRLSARLQVAEKEPRMIFSSTKK